MPFTIIKYIIPIVLGFVWVGGLFGVISSGSIVELSILAILAILLLGLSFIFMKLPAKSDKWDEVKQRF